MEVKRELVRAMYDKVTGVSDQDWYEIANQRGGG